MDFIALIRSRIIAPVYNVENPDISRWSDKELLERIIEVDCSHQNLASIPSLPNCEELDCSYNHITAIPELPNCQTLYCQVNKNLTYIPSLSNCYFLACANSKLSLLPYLPKCKTVLCYHNSIRFISELPSCTDLTCYGNPLLPTNNFEEWKTIWKTLKTRKLCLIDILRKTK